MPLRTYILLVVLYCLIGLCTVNENTRCLRARYRAARLQRTRLQLLRERARLEQRYAALAAPARLERLNRELGLNLRPLRPVHARPSPVVSRR